MKTPVGWGWAESLTDCPTYFCDRDSGPIITPNNVTRYLRWGGVLPPVGKKTNAQLEAQQCYPAALAYNMEAYNLNASWKWATYNSRADPEGKATTVQLMGWAMKSAKGHAGGAIPPRIVIQHGTGANQNNRFAQNAAYELRAIGFDVLVNGFRNHGWSGKSPHDKTTWGWAYPLDVLGAFDYAVADPDGYFGGPVDPSRVALWGVSLGGLAIGAAFGMDKTIGAAFIDSGPSDPKTELRAQFAFLGPLADLLLPITWWGAKTVAGVDLGRYTPVSTLPCTTSPRVRPVAVVASGLDTFVPVSEDIKTVTILATSPACYDVTKVWFPPVNCNGMYHGYEIILERDDYRIQMCNFFTKAFAMPGGCDYCDMMSMPWYKYSSTADKQKAIDAVCKTR